jgi:two-component system sensor kinase FixL
MNDPNSWDKQIHPDDRERVLREVSHSYKNDKPFASEYRMITKDGQSVWFRDEAVIVKDGSENPFCFQGVMFDISNRKSMEEELRISRDELEEQVEKRTAQLKMANEQLSLEIEERKEADERLRKTQFTLDHSPDAIAWVEMDGNLNYVNEAACRMHRCEREELLSMRVSDIDKNLTQEGWPQFWQDLETQGTKTFETFHRTKDGHVYPVEVVASYQQFGGFPFVCANVRDITERRQAVEESRRLREELAHISRVTTMGELTASLAHEINQPLTAILSNAQAGQRFLANDSPDLDEIRDILGDIVADDKRARDVIRQLRGLFKKGELVLRDFAINDLIQEVMGLINSEAVIRNVSLETQLDNALRPVRGDRIQLQQAILNLIMNALEAMGDVDAAFRKIIVKTEKQDEHSLKVAVRDFGIGLSKDELNRVFEPFYTTKDEGLGMGLAINQSIIEAHGGRIWATGNPDQGATFYFTLPIYDGSSK